MKQKHTNHRKRYLIILIIAMFISFILGAEEILLANSWVNGTNYIYPNSSWSNNVNITGMLYATGNITMIAPNGSAYNCGVNNTGTFNCR